MNGADLENEGSQAGYILCQISLDGEVEHGII
jgi:hypothetical protein